MSGDQQWVPCAQPAINDVLRWQEPLWAAPNKPRGKPDKIGEQQITARLLTAEDFLEFEVIDVVKLSGGAAPLKVKEGDHIRRKKSTLELGHCHKRVS